MGGGHGRGIGRRAGVPAIILALAVFVALSAGAPPARASDGIGLLVGYGYIKQDRLEFESTGHLLSIGIHTPSDAMEDGVFASFTMDFVVDHEYDDLTALAFTFEGAYAWGSDVFGTYIGMCMRSGLDGYPDSSWSPMDPGAVVGMLLAMGPVAIGAEFRAWLGWNVYQDLDNRIEPYFDARMFMSFTLD